MNTELIEQKKRSSKALQNAETKGIQNFSQEQLRDFVSGIGGIINTHAPELNINSTKIAFLNALYRNPKIRDCEISTVIGAFFQCALYGLDPNDGECYFIPRKINIGTYTAPIYIQALNYETGYQGYIKIYEELGYILDAQIVCKTDHIVKDATYTQNGWELEYTPLEPNPSPENIKYVFVTAIYPNGVKKSFTVPIDEIEKMRKVSPSQSTGDWKNKVVSEKPIGVWGEWYGEMAKKSAIRRLRKFIGKSITKNGYGLVDDGILNAQQFNIDVETPKGLIEHKEEIPELIWEMDREKGEDLWYKFIEQDKIDNPERTKEERKEAYLMEIEMTAGHREIKDLTEEQYNKLMEVL